MDTGNAGDPDDELTRLGERTRQLEHATQIRRTLAARERAWAGS